MFQLYSQALDLLLPAFSLFPDKEYMIVLQPSGSAAAGAAAAAAAAAASTWLSYFYLAERHCSSTLQHSLYILHRQTLLGPPLVQ